MKINNKILVKNYCIGLDEMRFQMEQIHKNSEILDTKANYILLSANIIIPFLMSYYALIPIDDIVCSKYLIYLAILCSLITIILSLISLKARKYTFAIKADNLVLKHYLLKTSHITALHNLIEGYLNTININETNNRIKAKYLFINLILLVCSLCLSIIYVFINLL